MKITVMTGLLAERNMDIYACQFLKFKMNIFEFPSND
jgi:hypothetical protein